MKGNSDYCLLIILLPIDYSYSFYMIILILSYYFFEKEERENRRNDKNKQCNDLFPLVSVANPNRYLILHLVHRPIGKSKTRLSFDKVERSLKLQILIKFSPRQN